ncbi:MAG: low molecular weight phosphotyrosine protein phosphatase [Myxococcota bacterium]|jgi:protein-tyrosine-phosphatase|nr:low molecular weight phosphotyrosine protein phosphatase [Myxococcota bacterium]
MKVTRLLVVCSDNTCCSPLAEALLQRGAIGRGRRDIWVESASAAGFRGLPVCTLPQDFAHSLGLDLGAHRSSPLTAEKILEADLVLCLEERHRRAVTALVPDAADRTLLLSHYLPPPSGDTDILDPHGSGRSSFRRTGERIVEACQALLDGLPKSARPEA